MTNLWSLTSPRVAVGTPSAAARPMPGPGILMPGRPCYRTRFDRTSTVQYGAAIKSIIEII